MRWRNVESCSGVSIPGEGFRDPRFTESSTCKDARVGAYLSWPRVPVRELADALARLLTRSCKGLSCRDPEETGLHSGGDSGIINTCYSAIYVYSARTS